ncbi:EAL domain-containing protein [Psychrosphaera sp. 1_MG-2023]|uniref:EAL domain-containing protein n=1 Tax=Psychrosphaera sp. 1_MG-2023 TaxID=3062643 RepID=UPI0026E304F5|nr:EAL domain-containing protein [Psychrosphaera sp. 1_MG-2023]MDO6720731.1 EAL domain-containing protein [Psychrosphaera sp. 1_MG-2023]
MLFKNSLKFRINKLVVSIVLLISIVILMAIWFATSRHADTQLSRELEVGHSVFVNSLESRENLLVNAATVLTEDFGFKQAIATLDSATIDSMLNNHSERISADLMLVMSLDAKVIGKTDTLTTDSGSYLTPEIYDNVLRDGGLITFNLINGKLYQSLFLTVDAPNPIAIAMIGFEMDQKLVDRFSQLTTLDITLLFDQEKSAYLTTLSPADAKIVLQSNLPLLENAKKFSRLHLTTQAFRLENYPHFKGYVMLSHNTDLLFKEFYTLIKDVAVISVIAVFVALLLGVGFSKNVTKPLERLSILAKRISRGDYQNIIELNTSTTEIADLSVAFKQMQLNISEREKTISYNATHDMVTGLYNRTRLLELVQEGIENNGAFQVIAIQINGFRELNETFGYKVGDECLQYLAGEIKAKGGCTARIAGGEVIWLPNQTVTLENIVDIQSEMERSILVSQVKVRIKLVIGIVSVNDSNNKNSVFDKAEDVIRSLSIAASHARTKSNNIQYYLPEQEAAYIQRIEVLYELQHLLESDNKDELAMFYQPKLALSNNSVDKMEALIRWNSKKLGFVSPEMFIPIAESAGIIKSLTQWVIRRVIRDLHHWQLPEQQIAINLSAQDIVCGDLIEYIDDCLKEFDISINQLSFEITESDIMSDPQRAIAQLNLFVEKGFSLAIDDFGTGHSSLSYIKDFPVQTLKIDKAFILQLDQNEDDLTIVKCIISLATNFGLSVVAEGIENKASLEILRQLGCQYIQGYYISRPMPASEVTGWLAQYHDKKVQE